MPKRTRLDRSIWEDAYGISVITTVNGKNKETRFKRGTTLDTLRRWRDRARQQRQDEARITAHIARQRPPAALVLKPRLSGFCYVYFIRCGDHIKIGRAVDPLDRMRRLQTASARKMQLLAAVPAHSSLEAALHTRFQRQLTSGEWFLLDDELTWFIKRASEGVNPVALLMASPDEQMRDRSMSRLQAAV